MTQLLTKSTNPACELVIVGEAFGEFEQKYGHPFIGKAGAELYRMLCEAGFPFPPISHIHPGQLAMKSVWRGSGIKLTNVFNEQPEGNKIDKFLAKKKSVDELGNPIPLCLDLPTLKPGMYLRESHRHHLDKLFAFLETVKPNLIIATGNTACWALLQTTKISSLRGTICQSVFGKVLPVYHPAAVLRNYEFRPITILDFFKARREMSSPDLFRKRREIWVEPAISDLYNWWEKYGSKSSLLSIDIETERRCQISEIGIASDSTHALHIPFIVNKTKSYWKTASDEIRAWNFVRMVAESPVPKLGQNFMYDWQFTYAKTGIGFKSWQEDTMLLHHALYPGMQKSLGFLGSCYTNELSWKTLRKEGNKQDE